MTLEDPRSPRTLTFLGTLTNLRARRHEIDMQTRLLVKAAVASGVTWREIGEALGTTGQSAWSTYAVKEPPKIKS